MAVTVYTYNEVLAALANELGELKSERATGASAATVTLGLSTAADDTYKYGFANIPGKGVRAVNSFASQLLTVASAFSPAAAAGDVVQLSWYKPSLRAQADYVIEETIRESYASGGWWRDVQLDLNNNHDSNGTDFTMLTLDSGTEVYNLPGDCKELFRVGYQSAATDLIDWKAPENIWRVTGEPGAQQLRFLQYPRGSSYADAHDGMTLCLRYAAAEPIPTTSSTTIELDKTIIARVAAKLYRQLGMDNASPTQLQRMGYVLPLRLERAREAWAGNRISKQRPPMPKWD